LEAPATERSAGPFERCDVAADCRAIEDKPEEAIAEIDDAEIVDMNAADGQVNS